MESHFTVVKCYLINICFS